VEDLGPAGAGRAGGLGHQVPEEDGVRGQLEHPQGDGAGAAQCVGLRGGGVGTDEVAASPLHEVAAPVHRARTAERDVQDPHDLGLYARAGQGHLARFPRVGDVAGDAVGAERVAQAARGLLGHLLGPVPLGEADLDLAVELVRVARPGEQAGQPPHLGQPPVAELEEDRGASCLEVEGALGSPHAPEHPPEGAVSERTGERRRQRRGRHAFQGRSRAALAPNPLRKFRARRPPGVADPSGGP